MKVVSQLKKLEETLKQARKLGSVGFVPTMGAFHEGHLSLMRKARQACDFIVVSLFVNPLQFGPAEDYAVYPRPFSRDREKGRIAGIDLLWTPSEKSLFPPSFRTHVEVGQMSDCWEGKSRPGHFQGVATVVAKLLQIVQPDWLYLGQKDYQQTCVIRRMMEDLHFRSKLTVCPTVREKDGLAMSSRNTRLSVADRKLAPILYNALKQAKKITRKGEQNAAVIIKTAESILRSETGIKIDYLALCDPKSLGSVDHLDQRTILLAAIKIGSVRLLDNIFLNTPKKLIKNNR